MRRTDQGPASPAMMAQRWSVEQRLAFIRARVQWEGAINRSDLVARFGISPNQATADLARFLALHPGGLDYDRSAKTYRAGGSLPEADPQETTSLLRELRLIAEGAMGAEASSLTHLPPLEIAEPPIRIADPNVVKLVLAAIRERRVLSAVYQSFTTPRPRRRHLEPHALVFDGFRWHARARDAEEDEFKDFVLGRLRAPRLGEAAAKPPSADIAWSERSVLTIAPHPGLSGHQRRAIEADYGMIKGRLILTPRKAVAYYVKRRLGLVEGHKKRCAEDQHIVLLSET